jgi:hypothetical protein
VSQTLNVHVRVNDAATGQPTPVRIRFADAEGRYYPPLGRPAEFPLGRNEDVGGHVYLNGKRYAYIDGACEVPLPTAVPLSVEISKGPAYFPIRETLTLGEGQLSLRFAIRRWTDERWNEIVTADTRCHFLTPHSAKLEAAAEGIDYVNLLAVVQDYPSQDGHLYRAITNITAFSGQAPALDGVYVNTFNVHPVLGRLGLLNCHRAVYPLTFGHIDETDDWSLSDWCDQCHRKKGLVIWCDAYRPEGGLPGGEALVNAILGKIDAIELDAHERKTPFLATWYRLLNAGIRLPIVGGSGKDSNRMALGGMRTLTPTDQGRAYTDWVDSVRIGRTVAGNGPVIRLTIAGQDFPKGVIRDSDRPLLVRVQASSLDRFDRLELIVNGEVVASKPGDLREVTTAELETEFPIQESSWIAARCWSTNLSELYPHTSVFAHTSPCFVHVPDRPFRCQRAAVTAVQREIANVRHWVETAGRFTNPRRKEHLLSLCDAAAAKLAGQS